MREVRFNNLSTKRKKALLIKDDFKEKDLQGMIDFMSEDKFGGPLVDWDNLTIIEF